MPTSNIFDPSDLANGTSALTVRDDALATSTDLVQAGVVFNDSTRLLDGGLWSHPQDANNQPAYLGMYQSDIHAVLNDVEAMLANPAATTLGGAAYTLSATDTQTLTQIESQLQTLLTDAPHAIGNSQTAVAAQNEIHATQLSILNEVQSDTGLATALGNVSYLAGTGATNTAFQALPVGSDSAADLAQAQTPGDTLAHIGAVYNAAANLAIGGLNATNMPEFQADLQAVATGVQNILNNPTQLAQIEAGESGSAAALTTIHLHTIETELQLQLNSVDGLFGSNPNKAARETNDNLLDIVDIVQNDANLNTAAGGAGSPSSAGGFASQSAYLNGPDGVGTHGGTITPFQDNHAETNFWANFITGANVLGAAAINAATQVQSGALSVNSAAVQNIISDIRTYQQEAASFDQHVGGVFGARFDNELLNGTLEADASAAIQAISTGNVNQATAAATGFIADAADVSGNNIPVGGGTFNSETIADGSDNGAANPNATVAAATTPNGVAVTSSATAKAIADAAALGATTSTASTGGASSGSSGSGGGATSPSGEGHFHVAAHMEGAHHLGHMWG